MKSINTINTPSNDREIECLESLLLWAESKGLTNMANWLELCLMIRYVERGNHEIKTISE